MVLSDQRREPYKFKTVAGFEHTYIWSTNGSFEANPDKVDQELPRSALPPADGSLLHIVTFPPAKIAASSTSDLSQVAQEFLTRLPGLADTFERDGSQMHVTRTVDYAIMLEATVAGTRRRRDSASFPGRHCRPAGDAPWLAQQGRTAGDDCFRDAGPRPAS